MTLTTSLSRQRLTDSALTLLLEATRAADAGAATAASRAPRILVSTIGPTDPVLIHRSAVLLRCVSIAEAYVDALMSELLLQRLQPPTELIRSMVHEIEVASTMAWPRREAAFKRLHRIRLDKCDSWKELQAAASARNCIAHGLGRLTASQRQSHALPGELDRIGITMSGGVLQISESALELVFVVCRVFVRSLDSKT